MTFQEKSVIEGQGFQHNNPRWGDYSTMSVDPEDDQTFWYTQEYIMVNGPLTWQTRVASFQLHKNFSLSTDSLVFMTFEECSEGKELVLKNNSKYDIQMDYIEPEGYYSGARWVIDPYGFVFPFQVNPGDSVVLTVKVEIPVEYTFTGFEVDTMDILTDYKNYRISIYVNDELMTGIGQDGKPLMVDDFSLHPNPFTTTTTLSYTIDKPSFVTIRIFNPQGQLIENIEQEQLKGEQQMQWNAEGLPAGMYYFRISDETGKFESGKLLKY